MRQKLIRVSSLFLAMLLFVSAIFPSGSVTVHAASSLKAALKEESGKGIPADEGWSLYKALQKVPASNRSYINLTEGKHASWAKDEQSESEYNAMKPVYGADLKDDTRYGIKYSNVELAGKKYNVTFVVDNVRGANGADKIIVFYDGQPGAVRFQGYKKCHFTITIDGIDDGETLHTAMTFQDIDCHQALEVTTPGRLAAADKGSSTLKVGSSIPSGVRSDLEDLGGTPDNTVFADTGTDQKDKDGSAGANKYRLDVDANFTKANNEFKGSFYAGGGSDFLSQTNGVFFYFTASMGATDYTPPKVVKAVNGKTSHDLTKKDEVFNYTLTSTIGDDVQNINKFGWHDTFVDGVEYAGNAKVMKGSTDVTSHFDISTSGKKLTIRAKADYLNSNPYGTFTATIPCRLTEGTDLQKHMEGDYAVFHNKGYVMWGQNGQSYDDKESNDVIVRIKMAELAIDKVVDKYEHQIGDDVVWTIKVTNKTSDANAYEVSMTDTIPSEYEVTEVSAAGGTGAKASHSGNKVTATADTLAGGGTMTVTVHSRALEAGNEKEMYNTASATCWNIKNSGKKADDDAESHTNSADLSIDKVSDRYEYEVGDTAHFTVKVKNNKGTANNVIITDALPDGMILKADSLKITYAPTSVTYHIAGTDDPTNKLNPEYRNETEERKITAAIAKDGDNGWKATINHMVKNSEATITFDAVADKKGNGKEQQNAATAKADNAKTVSDDAEYYINTAALSIAKKYINPYKDQKKDNRYDNEFRVFEEETGNEKVQYQVDVTSSGDDGTVAKDIVIGDLTLPDGLTLNYEDIRIKETAADGTVTEFKTDGGNGKVFKYHIAGTKDVTNQIDKDKYNETEDRTPVITLTKSGNGWKLTDSYLPKGAKLTMNYDCNAEEKVNGSEIINTATATAKNVEKDKDGKYKTVTANAKVYINSPRLVITKKADSEKYEVGDTITYTITTINRRKGTIARNLVFDDTITTEGVKLQKASVILMDSKGNVIKEKENTYESTINNNTFVLKTKKHLVRDEKHDRYDLYGKKNPETLESWNPEGKEYPGGPITAETQMAIEYQMVVTDKELAGKEIDNIATAVSDEALKVTDDEKVTPNPPNPQIEKNADKKVYYYGETATYTIRVTQERDAVTAKDVIIEDKFATEDDFLIDKNSFKVTFNGDDITKDVAITMTEKSDGFSIKTGKDMEDTDVILVTYKATPQVSSIGKDITNTALTYGSNTPKVHTTEDVKVEDEKPKLEITKTSDKAEYEVGETGKYKVVVTQVTDNATARNVVIEDAFRTTGTKISNIALFDPDGKDITKDVKISETEHGYVIETGKNLAQGQAFTVVYDVLFESEDLRGQSIVNVAKAKADNADPVETDHSVKIPRPTIVGGKTSDKAVYQKNETAHYTLTATNPDEKIIGRNLTFEDTVEVDYVEILADSIRVVNPAGKDITKKCEITAEKTHFFVKTGRDIKPGETYTLTYDMTFSEDSPVGEKVPNTFIPMVDGASFAAEYDTTVPGGPDVKAVKSCDPENGSTVHTGDEIEYHITVKNTGDEAAKNILIRDRIPDLTEYVKGGETFEIGDDLYVKFLVKELAPGKEETVSFTVKVTGEGYARIDNTAQVKSVPEDPEKHFTDEDFADTNTVVHYIPYTVIPEEPKGNPALKIEKSSDKQIYQVGETGHYTVVTTQVKEGLIAKNLVLKDDLQTKGAKIVHGSVRIKDPKGQDITTKVKKVIAIDTGYQIDTGMDLNYGESFTVTYDVLFEDETLAGKQVVNIAKSKADNASAETENDVTPVLIEDGLTALKTSDPANGTVVKPGQEITYTIRLNNTGKEDKKNVYVMDAIPDNTRYVDGSALFKVDAEEAAQEKAPEESADPATEGTEDKKDSESTETAVDTASDSSEIPESSTVNAPESEKEAEPESASTTSPEDKTESVTTEQAPSVTAAESSTVSTEAENSSEAGAPETASTAIAEESSPESTTETTEAADLETEPISDQTSAKDAEASTSAKEISGKGSTQEETVSKEEDPAGEKSSGTGEIRTISDKDHATWIIPVIPAGKSATVSFKVTVDEDATEEDIVLNTALVKAYGDKVPEEPWNPKEFTPTNETMHPLSPWVETSHTVDVKGKDPEKEDPKKDPEPENPTTEKEKPSTDKEKTTTEKKTETTKTTTGTPKSGTTTTKKDEGTISPKGGVQTGIHSHELLYAAIAAGLAGAAILVHRRRKKKNI